MDAIMFWSRKKSRKKELTKLKKVEKRVDNDTKLNIWCDKWMQSNPGFKKKQQKQQKKESTMTQY